MIKKTAKWLISLIDNYGDYASWDNLKKIIILLVLAYLVHWGFHSF